MVIDVMMDIVGVGRFFICIDMCSLFLLLYFSWAVVVPIDSDPRRPVKCELVIYISQKVKATTCFSSSFFCSACLKCCQGDVSLNLALEQI